MIVALRGGVITRARERRRRPSGCSSPAASPRSRRSACTVLADEATPVAQLSRAEAERRIAEAEAAYAEAAATETPEKRDAAMARLLSARARLRRPTPRAPPDRTAAAAGDDRARLNPLD